MARIWIALAIITMLVVMASAMNLAEKELNLQQAREAVQGIPLRNYVSES